MRRVLGGGDRRGGVLGGVDERHDHAGGAGVEGLADEEGVVGLDPDHADGLPPASIAMQAGEHARVAEQPVLGVEADVVVAEPGEPLGGDGRVDDDPVADGSVSRARIWRAKSSTSCRGCASHGAVHRLALLSGCRRAWGRASARRRPRRTRRRRRRAADRLAAAAMLASSWSALDPPSSTDATTGLLSSQRSDSSARVMPASAAMAPRASMTANSSAFQ